MDSKNLSLKTIKEGIERGNYEITGVLKTGEITVPILSDSEIEVLKKVNKYEDVQKFMNLKGRPAGEILQVYKQKTCNKNERCIKNRLRVRTEEVRGKLYSNIKENTAHEVAVQEQSEIITIKNKVNLSGEEIAKATCKY